MAAKSLLRKGAAFVLVIMLMSVTMSVLAAPDVLPATVESTAENLVTLKAPEQLISSTNNRKLPISATAPQGVFLTIATFALLLTILAYTAHHPLT